MEVYLDYTLVAMIGFRNSSWDTPFSTVKFCNALSILVIIQMAIIPVLLTVHFVRKKPEVWRDESFQERYGSYLDSTNLSMSERRQWIVLLVPSIFLVRRFLICVAIVYAREYFYAQMILLTQLTLVQLAFIAYFRPLESAFLNRLEMFTEGMLLLTMYLIFTFSDLVGSAE